ncbi:MAG: Fe-S cluster assembly protein SufD [Gammaproteobacteria bacterium]|nr:Fe-S cluster assembly protein SufD [Gammaproteobacteria bacterium]NIR83075.1 Fe-S cluster assembly protein SufD [Gammaproteobacteria bacterium]NIR90737.1 Fe-S cluster assembly protein SufD [Gammaproteobacteria bacterium]NIU04228.1 Fe-S cluster assembly protein SufD [Gammaproteobacteria bacterium]NIV51520.1 Fe-S cluster assembly protein SufD [Gammaproteobacteria bacterium]
MSATDSSITRYISEFGAVEAQLPGNRVSWLQRIRQGALARFEHLGFPTPRQEDWKYTRVTPIERRSFRSPLGSRREPAPVDVSTFALPDLRCHQIAFVDGLRSSALSAPGHLPAGVTVDSLARVLEDAPEAVEPHLARYADIDAHAFTALNTAFIEDGVYIHVAPDTVVTDPIHVLFVSLSEDDDIATHPRNLIVCGENSQCAVIESYVSPASSVYFNNSVTEVSLGARARLDHYKLQQESTRAFHVSTLQVHQARDSRFHSHSVSLGGALARNDINVLLHDEGAECLLNGLYVIGGRQHVDYHTRVDHAKANGTSREFYKGILDGRSRGVFNGRVYVHPNAQKSDAEQSNKNLLLSRDAEVDTKPQLEIFADDVKCSHGATVGQLDENMIYYLRSRGIAYEAARALLTYGFAQDIIERMPLAAARELLENLLVTRLPNAEYVRGLVQ